VFFFSFLDDCITEAVALSGFCFSGVLSIELDGCDSSDRPAEPGFTNFDTARAFPALFFTPPRFFLRLRAVSAPVTKWQVSHA
jgi:hypothetical protein